MNKLLFLEMKISFQEFGYPHIELGSNTYDKYQDILDIYLKKGFTVYSAPSAVIPRICKVISLSCDFIFGVKDADGNFLHYVGIHKVDYAQ